MKSVIRFPREDSIEAARAYRDRLNALPAYAGLRQFILVQQTYRTSILNYAVVEVSHYDDFKDNWKQID
jgi:hypothetical protein